MLCAVQPHGDVELGLGTLHLYSERPCGAQIAQHLTKSLEASRLSLAEKIKYIC